MTKAATDKAPDQHRLACLPSCVSRERSDMIRVTMVVSQLIALMANAPSQDQEAVLSTAKLSGISITLSNRTRLSGSSDSLNVRIMSTISDMDAEQWHKALQAFEYLREAKVNLLEKVRYGAPTGDIESAVEEFEEAWLVTERLMKQLIAPSKP